MKKSGIVFSLVTLLLLAAAMLLRKLELLTVLDAGGLAVFKPVTAVLVALCVLAAAFFILFSRQTAQPEEPGKAGRYIALGWGIAGALVQLYGAWLLFKGWKSGSGTALDLVLALLAGLAAAGWLRLRITEYRGKGSAGEDLLGGALATLFYCLWLIAYYRDEAPEPSLVLTVYAFLALCASCVAAYYYAGRTIGRQRPRRTLVFSGLAVLLSMVAQVRGEEPSAYRLFWIAGALQFWLCAVAVLHTPPVEENAPVPEGAEAEEETAPEGENAPEGEAVPEGEAAPEEESAQENEAATEKETVPEEEPEAPAPVKGEE